MSSSCRHWLRGDRERYAIGTAVQIGDESPRSIARPQGKSEKTVIDELDRIAER
jgi:hypothetical protein